MFRRITLAAAAFLACAATAAAADFSGNLNGSNYVVRVPDAGWNGSLVVLAHGYRDLADHPGEVDDTSAGTDAVAAGLAAAGYAVATTSYRSNGWAVKEAITDVVDVADHAEGFLPAPPARRLLAGFSMGGLTTLARAERGGFDGHLAMCAPAAGAARAWDGAAVNLLAHATVFGSLPAAWGTVADGDDDVDFESEGFATVLALLSNPANFGKFEFQRLVSGVPWSLTYYGPGIFTNYFFFTEARGELERRAGGPVVQNLDHTYSLTAADKAFLAGTGYPAAVVDGWLAAMNATRYAAPPKSRNYIDHYAELSGKIKRPLLTLHTAVDTLVPVNHESRYAQTVADAGRSAWLRQWYTDGDEHCEFTAPQIFSAVSALDAWVQTGVAPAGPPPLPGFLPGFVPGPWPQP